MDVDNKVIIKTNYRSTMTVRIDPRHSQGITMRAGSAVFARKIKLRLQNVKGKGKFYIRLGKLVDGIHLERERSE